MKTSTTPARTTALDRSPNHVPDPRPALDGGHALQRSLGNRAVQRLVSARKTQPSPRANVQRMRIEQDTVSDSWDALEPFRRGDAIDTEDLSPDELRALLAMLQQRNAPQHLCDAIALELRRPPPPPPPVARVQAPPPPRATNYDVPERYEKVEPRSIDLKSSVQVGQLLKRFYGINREDLANEILGRYDEINGRPYQPGDVARASQESAKRATLPGYKDAHSVLPVPKLPSGEDWWFPHWPIPSGNAIPVHDPSRALFTRFAGPGHPFTGIVHFRNTDDTGRPIDPEIVLMITQSEGEYLKQGVREHPPEDKNRKALEVGTVYGTVAQNYTTHAGPGASSHTKLSELIETKGEYENVQKHGMTIGFTVIKGGPETSNKYTFVSRSSNDKTFGIFSYAEKKKRKNGNPFAQQKWANLYEERKAALGTEVAGSVPQAWIDAIIASLEAAMGAGDLA